ncbi:RNA polymerase sigma factor [Chitinophaga defluvii]|uniref:Sigma-70 family RNA polymerase sigma factor n=1 Tax=Chitinophaga defluvii TaxID=3163343 RepID=A0ABV2T3B6_9BACT
MNAAGLSGSPQAPHLHAASSQEELWQRFRHGSRDALAAIYWSNIDDLYNYGLHFCGDKERVKDCLQDLFQDLWQSREHLCETLQNIRYYLLSCLRRKLLRALQKERRWRKESDTIPFEFELTPPHEYTIIQDEARKEQWQQLHLALSKLSRRQREAIYLRFFQNLSYQQVADIMSMRVDSVYNIISKAIGEMKKTLTLPLILLLLQR